MEREGRYTDEVLSRSRIAFMPVDDPEGYSMRAWMGVDMAGEEEHWPPQGGPYSLQSEAELLALRLLNRGGLHPAQLLEYAVRFRDPNVVWGDNVKSPRIAALQEYLEEFRPTFALDLHETFMASIGWTTATYPRPSKLDIVEHEDGDDYWRLLVDGGRIVGVQFIGRSWRALDAVVLSMLKHIDLEEARRPIERGLMMAEPWRVKLQSFLR